MGNGLEQELYRLHVLLLKCLVYCLNHLVWINFVVLVLLDHLKELVVTNFDDLTDLAVCEWSLVSLDFLQVQPSYVQFNPWCSNLQQLQQLLNVDHVETSASLDSDLVFVAHLDWHVCE